MSSLRSSGVLAVLLVSSVTGAASAQITSYDNLAAYSAAVGPHTVIAFTELPLGTNLGNSYQSQGVLFTDGSDFVYAHYAFTDGVGVDGQGRIDLKFLQPQTVLGVEFPGGLRIELYAGGSLLGSSINFAGVGIRFFGGVVSTQAFDRAVLIDWSDDLVYIDNLHVNGSGGVYCTAKVNSAGCTPAIASSGSPSASAGSGFVISASQVLSDKSGVLFYSKSGPAALSFLGGVLCAQPPLVRTKLQTSGGSPPCGGSFAVDFNAWIASGVDPALAAGQEVNAQYWSRDPGFAPPNHMSLSDAIEFVIAN